MASALTGASTEPEGSYVMVRAPMARSKWQSRVHWMARMDDFIERECASEPITLDRCREPLAEEASELPDEQVDAIRRHAHAMAHVLVEMFLITESHP